MNGLLLLVAGVLMAPASETEPAPEAVPASAEVALARHLVQLESKIDLLEKRMSQGHGAYRQGSSFLVAGGGSESVLERLRRLERELTTARGELATRDTTLKEIRTRADGEQKRAENLAEKADSLSHVRDNLVSAQQTLAERQVALEQLNLRLAEADLARLQGEKAYFLLAAGVLRLVPGQSQDLMELQEQVRQQAKILQPAEASRSPATKSGKGAP